ncbi:MAG TPA: CHAT domain-containing protein, partial [Cyanophyceae cyanobacterium]
NASIDTAGNTGGGSIILRHGGGTVGVPFTVGSDYNKINGTAGIISTGQDNQISDDSFLGSYRQGDSPSDIQLITSGTSQLPETILPRTDSSLSATDSFNVNNVTSSSLPPVEIDTAFEQLEESFTRQFQEHFGRTFNSAIVSLTQARQTLQKIEDATGTSPSLIYVVFVPSKLDSQTSDRTPTPRPTDQLQLLLVTAQGKPILKPVEGATRDRVVKMAQEFRSGVTNVKDSRGYRRSAQQLYQWLVKPLESELQARKIDNLVFLLDSGLRSIPIAALYDGQGFLIERYSVSLMPSLSLTDTRYHDIRESQVLAMGAETFADQKPLPAVPLELSLIAGKLWQGKSFLNNAFTLENLEAQRQQTPYGIIHLATHADFQPGAPDKSYIQLSNGKLRLDQLPQLGWNNPPLDLLVLSACRTALGDEKAELGFAGLAVQAGVKAALASLWYVSDEATLGLMSEFYEQLQTTPIKAEALRQAQLAMLHGRVHIQSDQLFNDRGSLPLPAALTGLGTKQLTHPYYWAAFTLVGNPW